jgi:hypothetical protein
MMMMMMMMMIIIMAAMTMRTAMITTQKQLINKSGYTHAPAYLTSCVNGNFFLGTLDF